MASAWEYEYRVWRTCRDPEGREDAELYRTHQLGSARAFWSSSQDGRWLPRGHDRGNVSPVLLYRKPAHNPQDGPPGHGIGWTPYGALEGTADVRCGEWPEPTRVFERSRVGEVVPL